MMISHGLGIARGILEKYGWKEGKGLGRHEHGMVAALKPKLKNDTAGVGYSQVQAGQFASCWWERAYNSAADDISITEGKNGVKVKKMSDSSKAPEKTCGTQPYDGFVKTSRLTEQGEESLLGGTKCSQVEENGGGASNSSCLTDDAIFKACGKRTAHKGARHGLKLSGKLARLARQEEQLVAKCPEVQEEVNYCSWPEESVKDDAKEKCVSKKKRTRKRASERYLLDESFGRNASSSKGVSYSVDESFGRNASSSQGVSYSADESFGRNASSSKGVSYSVNESFGRNTSSSKVESYSVDESFGRNTSSSKAKSYSVDDSFGRNASSSKAESYSVDESFGRNTSSSKAESYSVDESFGRNTSSSKAECYSVDESFGRNTSSSKAECYSVDESFGRNASSSKAESYSVDESFRRNASSSKAESYSVDESFGRNASSSKAEEEGRRHKKKKMKKYPEHRPGTLYVKKTIVEETIIEEIIVEETIVTIRKNNLN